MTNKQPMQADGDGVKAGEDGVGNPPTGGESSGGAYPNPHTSRDKPDFDGGQSDRGYRGSDNPNATTDPD